LPLFLNSTTWVAAACRHFLCAKSSFKISSKHPLDGRKAVWTWSWSPITVWNM